MMDKVSEDHQDTADTLIRTLSAGAAEIGVCLGTAELECFAVYQRELLLWNRRMNLISESSSRDIVVRHFLDSLTPAPLLERPEGSLIDIGSGGGFPGIPLRIALPHLQLSLVEPSRKKSSFLSHVVRLLAFGEVQVIRERVETLTAEKTFSGRFDTVISRAAFKLPELLRTASFFLKPGGQLIAMKGPDPLIEMKEAEKILEATGMVFSARRSFSQPGNNSHRIIITYNRVSG